MVQVRCLVILLSLYTGAVRGYNYCRVTPFHTLCGYSGPKAACGRPYSRGLTLTEKRQVLDYHNKLRSAVATGLTSQPSASDMLELEWDEELSWLAQAHADTCKFRHDCNQCRRLSRWRVGQNLYQSYSSRPAANDWQAAMDSWFWSEISLFPVSSVYRYQFSHVTGHYSQLVWATTSRLGCGLTEYRLGAWRAKYYVCNYGQGGNLISARVYSTGSPCSRCPAASSCSQQYKGLCSSRL